MPLSILSESDVYSKISNLKSECNYLVENQKTIQLIERPARDVSVKPNFQLAQREGLQTAKGQAQLLHDLANIELQAMELGIRTLREFPKSPIQFKENLAAITIEESRHLMSCLNGIKNLGFQWGDWPVHSNLWDACSSQDTLIERIFIVHCYLEGSGLDSGELILKKLSGVRNKGPQKIVRQIAHDEIAHVSFGLHWFRYLTREMEHANQAFSIYKKSLKDKLPPRSAKINNEARLRAGFSERELSAIIESQ